MPGKRKRAAYWMWAVFFVLAGILMLASHSPRPANLGLSKGRFSPCPSLPNCVCSVDGSNPHFIAPLEFKGDAKKAHSKLKQTLLGMSRVSLIEERDGYLYAEFRSALFRFVDDVEFSVEPDTKKIQVRSASRVGRSDLGANRRRVEEIRRRFAELQP